MTTECVAGMDTPFPFYLYHWCHDLTCREVQMGKIHIVALLIFVLHVSLDIKTDVCVDEDWTEVNGMEPYELFSDALSIFIELLFNVCKLCIILACIITTCINLFVKFLVMCVIQFSAGVLQMLV